MTCIIVEDQAPAQRILQKFITDYGFLELVGVCSDPLKALNLLNTTDIDLIFLDIHLPKISGMEFLKLKPVSPKVILTTAYSEFALESYEYDVADYLLKPFAFDRFVQAVNKAQKLIPLIQEPALAKTQENYPKEIFIKSGYEHLKIIINEVQFIKSDGDYTEIHLAEKKHLSSESLKYWLGFLDPTIFIQVHKSYMVNISLVKRISGNSVTMENGQHLPIGRVYKEAFANRVLK
jgi:DNA-binding LytR/AlgR family response regulator